MIGIYKIQNLKNNKVYIGSSKSLKRRQYQHFKELKKGCHHNKYLQHSYNKHGKDTFVFYVLEYCEEISLLKREEFWISFYCSDNPIYGYNIDLVKNGRKKVSDTTKIRMKKANKTLKPINQYDLEGNFVCRFDSIKECALKLNLKRQSIQRVLKNQNHSTGGFKFKLSIEEC